MLENNCDAFTEEQNHVEKDWRPITLSSLSQYTDVSKSALVFLLEDNRPGILRSKSRIITENLARRLTGIRTLPLAKDTNGRPFFFDSDLNVSISHAANCLLVAFSSVEVGVDMEYIRNSTTWPDLYRWINKPEDCLPYVTKKEFLDCWTSKESILKMLPGGFDYGVQRVSVPVLTSFAWHLVCVSKYRFFLRRLPHWRYLAASIALTSIKHVLTLRITKASQYALLSDLS